MNNKRYIKGVLCDDYEAMILDLAEEFKNVKLDDSDLYYLATETQRELALAYLEHIQDECEDNETIELPLNIAIYTLKGRTILNNEIRNSIADAILDKYYKYIDIDFAKARKKAKLQNLHCPSENDRYDNERWYGYGYEQRKMHYPI